MRGYPNSNQPARAWHRHIAAQPNATEEPDAIAALLDRVLRLINADCVAGFETGVNGPDLHPVATAGIAEDIGVLRLAAAHLCHQHDARRTNDLCLVEVARATDASSGDMLVIDVQFSGASLAIVAYRASGRPPFTISEERALRRMRDWIGDYCHLWWRQRRDHERGSGLHAALDLLGIAVFVIDGQRRLSDMNAAARSLLDAGDGLRVIGETLTATSLDDSARLQAAISHVSACVCPTGGAPRQPSPVLSIRRKDLRPLSVAVMHGCRAPHVAGEDEGFVVVHAIDPNGDVERLLAPTCAIYGLTGAEARLAKLLVGGASLAEATVQLRIQEPTARTYLKQVFAKTGTNRQAALVLLLLTSIVRTAPGIELSALH